MMLSWYGRDVSQKELGDAMRPYQVPSGDNDDKTIFTYEFVEWAKKYGLESIGRVNGDIELLKTFTANGIPVVVKTWLHVDDDIGHFRIVRGFDERKQVIIQDDSYEGDDKAPQSGSKRPMRALRRALRRFRKSRPPCRCLRPRRHGRGSRLPQASKAFG